MGIVGKLKEKLHIGDSDDKTATGASNSGLPSGQGSTGAARGTGSGTGTGTGSNTGSGSGTVVGKGIASDPQTAQAASDKAAKEGRTVTIEKADAVGVGHPAGGATGAASTGAGAGAGAARGSAASGGSGAGVAAGSTASGAGAGRTSAGPGGAGAGGAESVTIHERDPNWQKARDLTNAAEYQSKVSAAKAYEAEAFLVGAQESHEAAQEALNAKANLVAQAEAEKRNIGAADYIHREYDHAKKVQEDHEKHRIEINKNLETTQKAVAEKERELQGVLPAAQEQQAAIDALTGKLGSIQEAKAGLENKEAANANRLRELEAQKGQFVGEAGALEATVLQLNQRAEQLEKQAAAARKEADVAAARLAELKGNLAAIDRDQNAAARSLDKLNKDLEAYRAKEADLAKKLREAQLAAQAAADAAAAKEAELQLARQQLRAEEAKGQPIEQEIERHRKLVQEKERQYTEAMTSSKEAKAAYERFMSEANEADAAYKQALAEKERKVGTYSEHKREAEVANSRATQMWSEAKKYGNTGDANALQRLAQAEETLKSEEGGMGQLVTPAVGPKQPTTKGPEFTRTEDARETNEDTQSENVKTRYAANA